MKMIPVQSKGASSITSYAVELTNDTPAKELFKKARRNLLNVNGWHNIAGHGSAFFQVVNSNGEEMKGWVKEGNFLRISIPTVPESPAGNGFDWVVVEKINEQNEPGYQYVGIRVRPASPPFSYQKQPAHFFDDAATSTFSIERENSKVIAAVNGRNETPNIKTDKLITRIRNFLVAMAAMVGFNKPQWKKLVKGLLKKKI